MYVIEYRGKVYKTTNKQFYKSLLWLKGQESVKKDTMRDMILVTKKER